MKAYKCLSCGETFKSQGIGPHQRVKQHEGREEVKVPNSFPDKRPRKKTVALEVTQPDPPYSTYTTSNNYHIVEDRDGNPYLLIPLTDLLSHG